MKTAFIESLAAVPAAQWDALWNCDYPFVRHDFLYALERSGCTSVANGWQPHHCLVWDGEMLVAAMPLYLKMHSYGEYVFDWSWADAWHQCGLNYYPKWINAIPFTPATGPRWAVASPLAEQCLFTAVEQALTDSGHSGLHLLFPAREAIPNTSTPWLTRYGCQFHWFNQGYTDFEDFLERFASRKRKSLRRERRKVADQGIVIETLTGAGLTTDDWAGFYRLYQLTYLKRSGHTGYLNETFFQQIGARLAGQVMMVRAMLNGRWIAAALYFYDHTTLYGRYWGAIDEFDGLHFECCYYAGIEFAIARGLKRFDPGAQGEHKIQRGFTPVLTRSLHRVTHAQLASAVAAFLEQEKTHIEDYCQEARAVLPFREGEPLVPLDILLN